MDDEHAPAPWEVPPPWQADVERSNPAARWALGLGIASVVPGLGLGAVTAGVIGLVRAHRARGAGRRLAAVGLVLGAAFLVLDVGAVGLGVAHAVATRTTTAAVAPGDAAPDDAAPDDGAPDDGGGTGALPDPDDRTSSALSAQEQSYIDALSDVTYLNFNDETLLSMAEQSCTDLAAGLTPEEGYDHLNEVFGSGSGDAWDVQRAATRVLCPDQADRLTEGGGRTTT